MALTEIQLPNKTDFFVNLQNVATNMKHLMSQWKYASEFLENVGATDLDSMGVGTGQVRTDLIDFRIAINEMIDFFEGTSTTQTKAPRQIVDKIRRIVK